MNTATTRIATLARVATALSACLILGAAASANAAESADAPSVRVSLRDLNLDTAEGSQALYRRITVAAHQVCLVSDSRSLTEVAAQRICERAAVARAVQQVNSPNLAALYQSRVHHG